MLANDVFAFQHEGDMLPQNQKLYAFKYSSTLSLNIS